MDQYKEILENRTKMCRFFTTNLLSCDSAEEIILGLTAESGLADVNDRSYETTIFARTPN